MTPRPIRARTKGGYQRGLDFFRGAFFAGSSWYRPLLELRERDFGMAPMLPGEQVQRSHRGRLDGGASERQRMVFAGGP